MRNDKWKMIKLASTSPRLPFSPSPRLPYRLRGVGRVARERMRCCQWLRRSSASSILANTSLKVSPPNCRIFR